MKLPAPLPPLGAAMVVVGCAYFNGLYNANRLADDAERAEREGRPDEARSLWTQAAVKAESVAVRYPGSKHRDDALLLQGRAYREMGDCGRAVPPLRVAADSGGDPALRSNARRQLGACWVELGEADSAIAILSAEVTQQDAHTRTEALGMRGRAFLLRGDYQLAAEDLEQVGDAESDLGLALAYTGLGRVERAVQVLERHLGDRYDEGQWQEVLDLLEARDLPAASRFVDRLSREHGLTPGQRARLLVADGDRRLRSGDVAGALARFGTAAETAPDSLDGRIAAGRAAIVRARSTHDIARIPDLVEALQLAERGGGAGREVSLFADVLGRVAALAEAERTPHAGDDLRLFIAIEAVRDSLAAPALAAALWQALPTLYPRSPLAAKALLAAAVLNAPAADSLIELVLRDYPDSPYVLALRGTGRAEFVAVEDSLHSLLTETVPAAAQGADAILAATAAQDRPADEVIRHGWRPGKP